MSTPRRNASPEHTFPAASPQVWSTCQRQPPAPVRRKRGRSSQGHCRAERSWDRAGRIGRETETETETDRQRQTGLVVAGLTISVLVRSAKKLSMRHASGLNLRGCRRSCIRADEPGRAYTRGLPGRDCTCYSPSSAVGWGS